MRDAAHIWMMTVFKIRIMPKKPFENDRLPVGMQWLSSTLLYHAQFFRPLPPISITMTFENIVHVNFLH